MSPLVNDYTDVGEALKLVMAHLRVATDAETVPVLRSFGRVLAANVVAPEDIPQVPTSHMDGYAVASDYLAGATPSRPAVLRVVDTVGPGGHPKRRLKRGETIQVATGALLPVGTDAVVPVESAEVKGRQVRVGFSLTPGKYVYSAGQDIRRGERVLATGHRVRAQDVGILVSLGLRSVSVRRRVRVAVMATGNELTPASKPRKGKTVESHSQIFLHLTEALGCVAIDVGIARDDPKNLQASLVRALAKSDFVVTLGGTSAGKRDLVVGAVSGLQPEVLVHGLRLDRGRVTGLASVRGKPVLMLPGPIQAAANAFLIVGIPIIGALSGSNQAGLLVPCVLGTNWVARERFSDFRKVVYVKLKAGAQAVAEPISGETESMKLLTDADGYFVVPGNVKKMETGSRVVVTLVPGFSFV